MTVAAGRRAVEAEGWGAGAVRRDIAERRDGRRVNNCDDYSNRNRVPDLIDQVDRGRLQSREGHQQDDECHVPGLGPVREGTTAEIGWR